LVAKALRSNALGPLGVGALESVKAPPNRLTVDAELVGEVGLALARANRVRIRLTCSSVSLAFAGTLFTEALRALAAKV